MTSLRTKLVRTMVATLLLVATATLLVVAGLNYLSARSTLARIEGHLRSAIVQKGTGLVTNQAIALRDLVNDNAFGGVARLVERTVEEDEQVVYGLFLSENLRPWGYAWRLAGSAADAASGAGAGSAAGVVVSSGGGSGSGSAGTATGAGARVGGRALPDWRELGVTAEAPLSAKVRTETKTLHGETVFQFGARVVDDAGTLLGSLRYGLSDGPLRQAVAAARADSRRALFTAVIILLLLGAATSLLGVQLSRQAAARITQPLGALTAAVNAFAKGERGGRVGIASGDEIQLLGTAFDNMASELEDYYSRLEQMNRTLEAKVDERTRALGERNRDMRLVLDHVDQGLLTVSLAGRLAPERSAVVDRWFGAPAPDVAFVDYIRRVDPVYADALEMGLDALREDILPLDLCLSQLPVRLRHEARDYQCAYNAIMAGDRVDGVLVVIEDVSEELAHARQEAEGKERLAMLNAVAKDRVRFLAFADEVNELLLRLPEGDIDVQRRVLHTLKGNAGLVGLGVLASICHRLEDELVDSCASLTDVGLASLQRRWRQLSDELRTVVGDKGRVLNELGRSDLERLAAEVDAGASAAHIQDRLRSLALEPAEKPLARLGSYAQTLANRFGKGDLQLHIDGGGLRLDSQQWDGVWSDLVHVIRNAVDHGIEPEADRLRAGKVARPTLRLAARLVAGALVIEVEDDGRGIDWEAVRAAAGRNGLPRATEAQLLEAIFSDGLTTCLEVTVTSGRGIGLAAMRRQVERRGGKITIRSVLHAGTCFTFTFPLPQLGPRFGVDVTGGGAIAAQLGVGASGAVDRPAAGARGDSAPFVT